MSVGAGGMGEVAVGEVVATDWLGAVVVVVAAGAVPVVVARVDVGPFAVVTVDGRVGPDTCAENRDC